MNTIEPINHEIDVNRTKQEIASTSENALGMSDEFISNFKAMYYTLNATPDTQTKVFNEGKVITVNEINELLRKVDEKIKNHYTVIDQVTIYLSFNDGRNEELIIPEFMRKDWNIPASTKTISIKWDFYVKLPGYKVPQRHSLTVRMGSKLRIDEWLKVMMDSENDLEIDSIMADLVCRVDFVNAVLADELINRVEEWYKSLQDDNQESKFLSFFRKHNNRISKLIELMAPIIALFLIYGVTKRFLNTHSVTGIFNSSEQLSNLLLWLVISIIFLLIVKYIGYFLASVYHRKSKSFQDYSHLLLTKGDSNARDKAKKKNKTLLREISYNFIGSLLATIIISIWGFYM